MIRLEREGDPKDRCPRACEHVRGRRAAQGAFALENQDSFSLVTVSTTRWLDFALSYLA